MRIQKYLLIAAPILILWSAFKVVIKARSCPNHCSNLCSLIFWCCSYPYWFLFLFVYTRIPYLCKRWNSVILLSRIYFFSNSFVNNIWKTWICSGITTPSDVWSMTVICEKIERVMAVERILAGASFQDPHLKQHACVHPLKSKLTKSHIQRKTNIWTLTIRFQVHWATSLS